MKALISILLPVLITTSIFSQKQVDFGELTDGMVIPKGNLFLVQYDTLGTMIFNTSDSLMYLNNGVNFKKIPYSDGVEELNSADKRTKLRINDRSLSFTIDGTPTMRMDTLGRVSFLSTENTTYVGTGAGENHVEGEFNCFYGYNSGQSVQKSEDNTFIGYSAGYFADSTKGNTYLGVFAGGRSKGSFNTFLGYNTGGGNLKGDGNIGIGAQTLSNDSIGEYNVAIGTLNMTQNRTGNFNVSLGYRTMDEFKTGGDNIGIGSGTLQYKESGSFNVAIGKDAGGENTNGSSNIFIGSGAGYNEKGSEKLYIEPSTSSDPLIFGDFIKDELVIHGRLSVNNKNPQGALHVKQQADAVAVIPGQLLDTLSGIAIEKSNGDTTWNIAIDALNGLNFSLGKTLKAYVDPLSGKWITATGASPLTSIPTKSHKNYKTILSRLEVGKIPNIKEDHYALIHDSLKKNYPEALVKSKRKVGVDYDQIVILNLNVLKELIMENEQLKKEQESYEERLSKVEMKLSQMAEDQ